MEPLTELMMDQPPTKKRRLGSDVLPKNPKAQPALFSEQEVGNMITRKLSEQSVSPFVEEGGDQNGSPTGQEDDHYEIGENLTSCYKIHSKIGEGTFSQVFECIDEEQKEKVAIKIVQSKSRDAAMEEVAALQKVGGHGKVRNCCVQMRNWFDYRNHICIVFERLGPSLYDVLCKNNFSSFPIDLVREIGRQLLECVAFMHELHIIHTDLKPENVLFVSPEYSETPDCKDIPLPANYKKLPKSSAIKVIDFGSSAHGKHETLLTHIVSTRNYRAPEVILGLGWSYPCDIWSVGCILVELCRGDTLFEADKNLEHLAMMERVLGPLPQRMLENAGPKSQKYVRSGRLNWPDGAKSRFNVREVSMMQRLAKLIIYKDDSIEDLIDLLQGLLRYEPGERMSPQEALKHPFFTRGQGQLK